MRTTRTAVLAIALFTASLPWAPYLAAQAVMYNGSGQPPVTAPSVTLTLADAPTPVTAANVALVGNPGHRTVYYWIVTNTLIGSSTPAGPFPVIMAADTFYSKSPADEAGAKISWTPVGNAVSYDVLRTWTALQPSGACNCAVGIGMTLGYLVDTMETPQSYTVNPVNASAYTLTLTNKSVGLGQSALLVNGSQLATPTLGPVYNVTSYGAKGDGVHDDAPAIASATAAALAAGGGTVYFPKPVNFYHVHALQNSPPGNRSILYFSGLTNITFQGDGYDTVVTGDTLNVTTLEVYSSSFVRVTAMSISAPNGTYVERFGYAGGAAVRLSACSHCEVDHLFVNGASEAGIYLTNGTNNTSVHENTIVGTWGMGINEDACASNSATGCGTPVPSYHNEIYSNRLTNAGNGATTPAQIFMDGSGFQTETNVHDNKIVYDGAFGSNTISVGILNNNNIGVKIHDNAVNNSPGDCIANINLSSSAIIKGNHIYNCGQNGVHVYLAAGVSSLKNVNIAENSCFSTGYGCVTVDANSYAQYTISGIHISDIVSSCAGLSSTTPGTYSAVDLKYGDGVSVFNITADGCAKTLHGVHIYPTLTSVQVGNINTFDNVVSIPVADDSGVAQQNSNVIYLPNGTINVGSGRFTVNNLGYTSKAGGTDEYGSIGLAGNNSSVLKFNTAGSGITWGGGLSHCGAACVSVGNGTYGDLSGTFKAAKFQFTNGVTITYGAGAPSAGMCAAPFGGIYVNTSGGASTTLYVCTAAGVWSPK